MAVEERDPHSGHMTTGHDWNGIKELNRPVPKIIWWFLGATVLFAVVWWVLMPTWPLGATYTRGLLGVDQRTTVTQRLAEGAAQQTVWASRLEAADFTEAQADEELMRIVRQAGRTLFRDNCGVCHGVEGRGGPGYPSLVAGAWLWGGDPQAIAETVRVGINADHPETRFSEMPAFGRDQMLDRRAIQDVVTYVRSLSDPGLAEGRLGDAAAAGAEVFAENCAACHGEDGRGSTDIGAPDLADGFWIYGGDRHSIYTTLYQGRQGHMPAWDDRLTPVQRKILSLYVVDLGERDE